MIIFFFKYGFLRQIRSARKSTRTRTGRRVRISKRKLEMREGAIKRRAENRVGARYGVGTFYHR